jgi:adenylate cyclase
LKHLDYRTKKHTTIAAIIFVGALLGLIYSSFSDGFQVIYPHVNTVIIGILVGGLISYLEFYVFPKRGRRIKFIQLVVIRSAIYILSITAIVFIVLLVSRMIRLNMGFGEVLASDEFRFYLFEEDFKVAIVYTVAFAFIINFSLLMSRKIGRASMWDIISGKHFKPDEVERIFIFLSIRNSDQIIHKVGRLKYHMFLADFIHDITMPILERRGTIYEYVEDTIVISWKPKNGIFDANCIRAFFECKKRIFEKHEHYYINYGFIPKFIAGYHIGNVVRGEIGEIKSPLVFFGDVMNTTSRIMDQCKIMGCDLIVSAHLRYRLNLPEILQFKSCGNMGLKGKRDELELFEISEKSLKPYSPA